MFHKATTLRFEIKDRLGELLVRAGSDKTPLRLKGEFRCAPETSLGLVLNRDDLSGSYDRKGQETQGQFRHRSGLKSVQGLQTPSKTRDSKYSSKYWLEAPSLKSPWSELKVWASRIPNVFLGEDVDSLATALSDEEIWLPASRP